MTKFIRGRNHKDQRDYSLIGLVGWTLPTGTWSGPRELGLKCLGKTDVPT